jgi:hypothetical protein
MYLAENGPQRQVMWRANDCQQCVVDNWCFRLLLARDASVFTDDFTVVEAAVLEAQQQCSREKRLLGIIRVLSV